MCIRDRYNGCPTSRYPAADGRYRVRNAEGQFLGLANITGGVLKDVYKRQMFWYIAASASMNSSSAVMVRPACMA